MNSGRNKLYLIILVACFIGYIWLYFNTSVLGPKNKTFNVCLIKHLTNIPCPSCGSTRSVISLVKGNFVQAFKINPLGYIITIIMLLAPLWIIFDFLTKRQTLFSFFKKLELYIQRPRYAVPLIFLVIFNWIWNIAKGL